jgi:hypothetical protein
METDSFLLSCKERIPWQTMRNILHSKKLPVGQGWDATIQKLDSFRRESEANSKKMNALEDAYFEHLMTGEKALQLFEIDKDSHQLLIKAMDGYKPDSNDFNETFPFPLSEAKLKELDSSSVLVHIEISQDNYALVYCTKRYYTERHELRLDSFSQETKDDLCGYDEIIALKRKLRQCFDIVVLDKTSNIAELRIDMADVLSSDDIAMSFKSITNKFNTLSKELIGIDEILDKPINFFPIIDKLYNSAEGRVCELSFTTDEASIKNERMRRKDVCLREESYHKAGKKGVPHITPYKLGITWTVKISDELESKPELLLPGHFRLLSVSPQYLGDAIITRCFCNEDFNFVVGKIKHYLN